MKINQVTAALLLGMLASSGSMEAAAGSAMERWKANLPVVAAANAAATAVTGVATIALAWQQRSASATAADAVNNAQQAFKKVQTRLDRRYAKKHHEAVTTASAAAKHGAAGILDERLIQPSHEDMLHALFHHEEMEFDPATTSPETQARACPYANQTLTRNVREKRVFYTLNVDRLGNPISRMDLLADRLRDLEAQVAPAALQTAFAGLEFGPAITGPVGENPRMNLATIVASVRELQAQCIGDGFARRVRAVTINGGSLDRELQTTQEQIGHLKQHGALAAGAAAAAPAPTATAPGDQVVTAKQLAEATGEVVRVTDLQVKAVQGSFASLQTALTQQLQDYAPSATTRALSTQLATLTAALAALTSRLDKQHEEQTRLDGILRAQGASLATLHTDVANCVRVGSLHELMATGAASLAAADRSPAAAATGAPGSSSGTSTSTATTAAAAALGSSSTDAAPAPAPSTSPVMVSAPSPAPATATGASSAPVNTATDTAATN